MWILFLKRHNPREFRVFVKTHLDGHSTVEIRDAATNAGLLCICVDKEQLPVIQKWIVGAI